MAYPLRKSPVAQAMVMSVQGKVSKTVGEYLFVMVLSGALEVVADNTQHFLNRLDLLLLPAGQPYQLSASGSNLILMVGLQKDFFAQGQSESLGKFICDSVHDTNRDYTPIRRYLSQITMLYMEQNDISHLRMHELAYSLLFYLNRYHYQPMYDMSDQHSERHAYIVSFIERNYALPLTLQDLSKELHLTGTYLSKYIKKNLGVNFYDYLNSIRLKHAVSDLISTNQSVTVISFNNGFPSTGAFIKLFKETYGDTPQKYRNVPKREQNATDDDHALIPMSGSALNETLLELSSGTGFETSELYPKTKTILIKDVNRYHQAVPLWRSMINIGFSKNVGDSDLRTQLAMAQKDIGFKYCRIQGILSHDILSPLPNGSGYNFTEFDRFIEFLLSIGLTPFLDLAYRKHVVFFSPNDYVYTTGASNTAPVSEERYLSDISALIRHCINTFGDAIVESWGFEICYNHDESLNLLESPSAFAKRFAKVCELIRSLSPNALVGGIGHSSTISTAVFRGILNSIERLEFAPDFISLTIYPFESKGHGNSDSFVISADTDFASRRIDDLRDILSSYKKLTQRLFVTSFGSDVSSRNYANDTCYQAAFIAKNTIDLLEKVEVLGYWQLTDIEARYMDTTRILFGGNGIISRDGIKKPGFLALELLGQISPYFIERGDGYLVATNRRNTLYLIIYNYIHFNDVYRVSSGSRVSLEEAYSVFEHPETKDFSVTLSGLPDGNYKVVSAILGREHGSLLDEWLNYGILDNLQSMDLQYLRDITHPQRLANYMDCRNNQLNLRIQLLPHEVKVFTFNREL